MVIAPARRAGDPGSIPGPGENFSLELLIVRVIKCRRLRWVDRITRMEEGRSAFKI